MATERGPSCCGYADTVTRLGLTPAVDMHLDGEDDDRWSLNDDVLPAWLVEFTHGLEVLSPEAGYPQLCRIRSPANWGHLLREHPDHVVVNDAHWPTGATIDVWSTATPRVR